MVIHCKLYLSFLYMSTKHTEMTVSPRAAGKPDISIFSSRLIDAFFKLCYNTGRKDSFVPLVVWKEMITYG